MASTRSTTGNSRPRVHLSVETGPERKHRAAGTTKKRKTTKSSTTTGAGVKKRGRPATGTTATTTHHKRKSHLSDKIEGLGDKIVGAVTHKPGKKAAGTKKIRGTDGKGGRGGRKARV